MKKATNRIFAILLACLLLCGILPLAVSAADPVDITESFTDLGFRASVYRCIGKSDSERIYDTDVAEVTTLVVGDNYSSAHNLNGLMHFKNLESLDCSYNYLTDISELPAGLKSLKCTYNGLNRISAALPAGLEHLDCSYNGLTSLPALPNSLVELVCRQNALTSLPALPSGLKELDCGINKLITLPALPSSLTTLMCELNQLASLPALPSGLVFLDCGSNKLKSLPALPTGLKSLYCGDNQLTGINVTGLSLDVLSCVKNNMASTADVVGFTGVWDGFNFRFDPQNSPAEPEPPSFLSAIMQFILKYLLFGWLWMNWF